MFGRETRRDMDFVQLEKLNNATTVASEDSEKLTFCCGNTVFTV